MENGWPVIFPIGYRKIKNNSFKIAVMLFSFDNFYGVPHYRDIAGERL